MRTLLVAPSRQHPVADRLATLLCSRHGFVSADRATPDGAAAAFQDSATELVFVVLTAERVGDGLRAVGTLAAVGARVIVVGPATDPKLILGAMQAGGERFLDQQDLEADLASILARLSPRARAPRQLIAVLSASGGCGASTVAVNLAVQLAAQHERCNLIDLNAVNADLASLLDLKPQYTLADLCRNEERLDRTLYEKLLAVHASGVALLAGPRSPEEAHALTTDGVGGALALAREAFAHIVVDLEDHFHDEQTAVLEQATRILLVCRLEFTAIRHTRRVIDGLAARGVARERIEVVVNHAGLPNELSLADAEGALGGAVAHVLPHDPQTMNWATNTGVPAALQAPDAAVVRGLARIAGVTVPEPQPGALARLAAGVGARARRWLRGAAGPEGRPAPILMLPQTTVDTKVNYEPVPAAGAVPYARTGAA